MSGNFVRDACRLVGFYLPTATSTTVHTATGYTQVIGIRLANVTGANALASVWWFDNAGAKLYALIYQHTVPANGAVWLPLEAFALNQGDEIRVNATANALNGILSIAETPGRSG